MTAIKRRIIIVTAAVVVLAVLVWLLGYTDADSDPANIYVVNRGLGGAETVLPGSTVWLFPLVDSLVYVPSGLQELSDFVRIKASDGELDVEVRVELNLDPEGAVQVVEAWGGEWQEELLGKILDEVVGEESFDGTVAELYGHRRGELLVSIEPELRAYLQESAPALTVGRVTLPSVRFASPFDTTGRFFAPVKVVVLGIDALEDTLLEKLINMGELPHFARMRQEGYLGVLQSEAPYFSPMIWTTFATGKSPDEHGITAFTHINAQTGQPEPLSALDRKVSTFWEFLGGYGLSSIVVNWYYSWPTAEMNGFHLTNYAWEPKFGKGFTGIPHFDELPGKDWPEGITATVDEAVGDNPYVTEEDYRLAWVLSDIPAAGADNRPLEGGPPLPHYLERDILAANAVFWLMDNEDWNIAAVYQEFLDVLCHLIWPAHAYYWEKLTGEPANLQPIPPNRR
ncbi:alkaline phosphatase family protein, partial [bacterium]|nr:alkaline phosphatase family protein [bacterium]